MSCSGSVHTSPVSVCLSGAGNRPVAPNPGRIGRLSRRLLALLLALGLSTTPAFAQIAPPEPPLLLSVISLSRTSINFGAQSVRTILGKRTISIENLGREPLNVTSITSNDPAFRVSVDTLGPIIATDDGGGPASFEVIFDPVTGGVHSGLISLASNDVFNPVITIPVTGEGVDAQLTVTSPPNILLVPFETAQLTATVTGSSNKGVNWTVVTGASTAPGEITPGGLFTAGPSTGTVVVRASSAVDSTALVDVNIQIHPVRTVQNGTTAQTTGAFGTSVVVADLNGDNNPEVITGVPEAAANGVQQAGQVWIRSFDRQGFSGPTSLLTSNTPATGDRFGASLASGDLNGDGNIDLLVGAPADGSLQQGPGRVHLFIGRGDGSFDPAIEATLAGGLIGDRFGAALVVGTFADTDQQMVAIGVPGRTVAGSLGAGAVYFMALNAGVFEPVGTPLTIPLPVVGDPRRLQAQIDAAGAHFGTRIAAACLDNCTRYADFLERTGIAPQDTTLIPAEAHQANDLIVAAPDASHDGLLRAGRVFSFLRDSSVTGVAYNKGVEIPAAIPAARAGFGLGLVAGDINNDGLDDVAIGAPDQPIDFLPNRSAGGMVFLVVSNGFGQWLQNGWLIEPAPKTGARFGQTLLIDEFNEDRSGSTDLVVAATDPLAGGRVYTFYGDGVGAYSHVQLQAPSNAGIGDRFGSAMASSDLNQNGLLNLVVSSPGAASGAGQLEILLELPPPTIRIAPSQSLAARSGTIGTRVDFGSQIDGIPAPQVTLSILGRHGSFDRNIRYTPSPGDPGPMANQVVVVGQSSRLSNLWGLAQIRLENGGSGLFGPEVVLGTDGRVASLGGPEAGLGFGSAVSVVHTGRLSVDPFNTLGSVLASFRAVNSNVIPRLLGFPFDNTPGRPLSGVQIYLGNPSVARSGWGNRVLSGDFNGDGNEDIAVSAPFGETVTGINQSLAKTGFVNIFFLGADGRPITAAVQSVQLFPELTSTVLASSAGPVWNQPSDLIATQWGLELVAEDINGDGRADLIVGAPHADVEGVRDAGLVEVMLSPEPAVTGDPLTVDWLNPVRATLTEDPPRTGAYFGSSLVTGDLHGDGSRILFVGAPGIDPEGATLLAPLTGRVTGYLPDPATPGDVTTAWDWTTSTLLQIALRNSVVYQADDPTNSNAAFGAAMAMGNLVTERPDATGIRVPDPAEELIISAPRTLVTDRLRVDVFGQRFRREVGVVWVYGAESVALKSSLNQTPPAPPLPSPVPLLPNTPQADMVFGSAVAIGHMKGPNAPVTLVVGAPRYDGPSGRNSGRIYLFEGGPDQVPRLSRHADAPSASPNSSYGQVITLGDLDLDGFDELVVGAPSADITELVGFSVNPGRFGGTTAIVDKRKQTGRVYVIVPGRS